jgi:hypothetical protein
MRIRPAKGNGKWLSGQQCSPWRGGRNGERGQKFPATAPSYRRRREREGQGGPHGLATDASVEPDRRTGGECQVSPISGG